ncbi:MAG: sensor histidine kinase [Edaphobacter sp.]
MSRSTQANRRTISERELPEPFVPEAGIRLNGQITIFSLATILALATASECRSITHLPSLMYGAVLWGWWGCIASVAWRLGQRIPFASSFSLKVISVHVLVGSALGIAHLLLLGSLSFTVPGWQAQATPLQIWTSLLNINRFGIELLLYGFVLGITGVVQFQIRAQRDAMRSLELQRQLSAAHLRALQMQMEPHFLFNTLNAITTLVELGRQAEAVEALGHLNALLKTTLSQGTPEKIPLARELEFIENYLAIEQIRFADRLKVEMKVTSAALDGMVPCFLLQPVIENAIRHGIAHLEEEGTIQTSIHRDGDTLQLTVRDNGPGLNGHSIPGHGIGLKNTEQRLSHFYQDAYRFVATDRESGGFEVSITIPYERELP